MGDKTVTTLIHEYSGIFNLCKMNKVNKNKHYVKRYSFRLHRSKLRCSNVFLHVMVDH